MEVIAYDPFIAADRAQRMQVKLLELDELFRTADYVTLHIPRTKDTENLVNAELLRTMKPTARIVNCARGGVVEEAAIAEAINNGVIAGAGLDVYASEPLAEDSPPAGGGAWSGADAPPRCIDGRGPGECGDRCGGADP